MIYVFLAEGFEEIEALSPVDILRRAGKEVKTVGVTGKTVKGSHNIEVTADILLNEVDTKKGDAYILPGGIPGTPNLKASKELENILKEAHKTNKLLAAICAAPSVFGGLGFLDGIDFTCFPGHEKGINGNYTGKPIEVNNIKKIITAIGAGQSSEFGFAILNFLCGNDEKSKELKLGMKY